MSADSLSECFIECDCKNFVIKDEECGDYGKRKPHAKPDFARSERKN